MAASLDELKAKLKRIRRGIVTSTTAAASGHPTSSLSAAEMTTAIFFGGFLKFDAKNPHWPQRDRFILSKGHAAPLLYAVMAEAGYFSPDLLVTLRKLGSPLEGHPNYRRLPGVEASTGSLGQGLSLGVGHALAAKLDKLDSRVFVVMGDGEIGEGQVWEAAMSAAKYKLDNLVAVVDQNGYQQTGATKDVLDLLPHRPALGGVRLVGPDYPGERPVELPGRAEGGGGGQGEAERDRVPDDEGIPDHGDHQGRPEPPRQAAHQGRGRQGAGVHRHAVTASVSERSPEPSTNPTHMQLTMGKATREAFGQALAALGAERPDVVVVDGDVGNSTRTELFGKKYPERFFNVGIAEANLVGVAAGLASAGKQAWLSSFATFVMCNAYDQLRMSVAFPNIDVKVVGTHAGISIGEDGPSQMGIEDVGLALSLPGFTVLVPADEPSMHAAVKAAAVLKTPVYIRAGRPNVPVVYPNGCPFQVGKANVLRDGKDATVIANGLLVGPALIAADHLAGLGIQVRVLDFHTAKPCDDAAVLAAAKDTGKIVVAEEHLLHGGLGSVVAMSAARQHPVPMRFIGLNDTFAESGPPEALVEKYGLTAENIAKAVRELVGK